MVVHVAHSNDPQVAAYAHVADAAWLKAAGLFVVEGRLLVQRLIASGRYPLHSLLATSAALQALGGAGNVNAPIFLAEREVISRIAGFDFHRGCLALAQRPGEMQMPPLESTTRLLAIEGVADPANLGGLFRVAAAFGVAGVLLDPKSADPLYRKALRTSMGAVLHLPFVRLVDWPMALPEYKARGVRLVALTPRADARRLADIVPSLHPPFIVMVGAEGAGLSEEAMDAADVLVRIPTAPAVDSLNVTVAAGIVLSQLAG